MPKEGFLTIRVWGVAITRIAVLEVYIVSGFPHLRKIPEGAVTIQGSTTHRLLSTSKVCVKMAVFADEASKMMVSIGVI